MKSVYGRKALAADAVLRETWMGRFTQLEPNGGFRAVVQETWSRIAPMAGLASRLNSQNGRAPMKPVYARKGFSAEEGVSETWMDLFMNLEPDGGFRAIVERTWNWNTPTSTQKVTSLAA